MTLSWNTWQAPLYPGRLIAVGRDHHGHQVIVYVMTGRSPSSQARRLLYEAGELRTDVTDPTLLAQGNPQLLLYDCMLRASDHFLISNGSQTLCLAESAEARYEQGLPLDPLAILVGAHRRPFLAEATQADRFMDLTQYEPDPPHWTPRICAVVGPQDAAMSITKRVEGETCRNFFVLPMQAGTLHLLTTYAGSLPAANEGLPSFAGEPVRLSLPGDTPHTVAQAFCEAFAPRPETDHRDFRVSIATMFYHPKEHRLQAYVWNRHPAPESEEIS
ncbi:IMP cyclohydrolase [Myxococcota bacterium]|nr:IMP cyclohydrolase [Myxococcota bacterium]